jgi:hypothetical protein
VKLPFDEQIRKADDQGGCTGMKANQKRDNPLNVLVLISAQRGQQMLTEFRGSPAGSLDESSVENK